MNRRQFLHHCIVMGPLIGTSVVASRAAADANHGLVNPPLPVPTIRVQCADGQARSLRELLLRKTTALNLIFVGCSTVCPIQAAVFQRLQGLLPEQIGHGIQLLSLSIDPQNDGPDELRNWLRRHKAGPGWSAAVPQETRLADVQALFGQGGDRIESHATRVSIINRRAELVWRTENLPPAEELANLLQNA